MSTKEQIANEFKEFIDLYRNNFDEFKKKYPVGSQIKMPFNTKNGEVTPDTKFTITCIEKDGKTIV